MTPSGFNIQGNIVRGVSRKYCRGCSERLDATDLEYWKFGNRCLSCRLMDLLLYHAAHGSKCLDKNK